MENALYAEIERLKSENAILTESVDEWRRQWKLMQAAETKAEEEIARLEQANEIANNTITLMAGDIKALKAESAELSREKHLLLDAIARDENETTYLHAQIDKLEEENKLLKQREAELTAQRDKAGKVALELEQRCMELDMELSKYKSYWDHARLADREQWEKYVWKKEAV
jgi:hypothetical protein